MPRSVLASTMSRFDSIARKNGQRCVHRPQLVQRALRRSSSHCDTAPPKPYQPGSIARHWLQLNTHGMARRSSSRCEGLREGGPAADVEARDLGDRRRRAEVVHEARRAARGRGSGSSASAESSSMISARRPSPSAGARREARLERGRHQDLEVAPPVLRVGVLARDDLALLGEAQRAVHAARRLRQHRLVARPAAAAHRAAAAVEEAQPHAVRCGTPARAAWSPCTAPSSRRRSRRPCCCRSSRASLPARRRAAAPTRGTAAARAPCP